MTPETTALPESALPLALEWLKMSVALKAMAADEAAKRAELVAACFPNGLAHGANTAELARGYQVKAVVRPSPKIELKALETALGKLRAMGDVGVLLAGRLIGWSPVLSLTEWKKLPPALQKLFKAAIVIGDSSPSVKLVEPA